MSDTEFWKPVYHLFKPEEPLEKAEDLRDFYVQRTDSPIENLIDLLEIEYDPAKFLLAGHQGSGKTTELKRLKQALRYKFTVVWVDTATALDRYNIGHAEVIVLIGFEIYRVVTQSGWGLSKKLIKNLEDSFKTVVYEDTQTQDDKLGTPDLLEKIGLVLKRGLTREVRRRIDIRPDLSKIIERVNEIVRAVEKKKQQKLLVIVDGLDRHDLEIALPMFSSRLLTELNCHIVYTIPISLRYSPGFRQPIESFSHCLDLTNLPVFECDRTACPTTNPNRAGRNTLIEVIQKRLARLDGGYSEIFSQDALDLLAEKSGGVMRDLIRLARIACRIAIKQKLTCIEKEAASLAVKEDRKVFNLSDYHFPELDTIHRTGRLTTNTHTLPEKQDFVICDELLQYKFVLGYYDQDIGDFWFDVNPILMEDLQRWQAANLTSYE